MKHPQLSRFGVVSRDQVRRHVHPSLTTVWAAGERQVQAQDSTISYHVVVQYVMKISFVAVFSRRIVSMFFVAPARKDRGRRGRSR